MTETQTTAPTVPSSTPSPSAPQGVGVLTPSPSATPSSGAGEAAQSPLPAVDWTAHIPPDLAKEKYWDGLKGKPLSEVLKSYGHAQSLIGKSIRPPSEKATPEEVAKWREDIYTRLGRPSSPDKYEVKRPPLEELGLSWNEQRAEKFLKLAHRIGLNSEQVQAIIDHDFEVARESAADSAKAYEACMEALEKGDDQEPGWGSATRRYLSIAKRVVDTQFPKGMMERLDAVGLTNDPTFIRGLYRIGRTLIEDEVIFPDEEGGASSIENAQKEVERVMNDKTHPYWNARHPDHEQAVIRMKELRQFIVSGAS